MQTREDLERYPLMKGRGPWDRPRVLTKITQTLWHFVMLAGLLGFESDLTRAYASGDRTYWVGFILLTLFSNFLYFLTSLSDPGYLDPGTKQVTSEMRVVDVGVNDGKGDDDSEVDIENQTLLDSLPSDFPPLEFCNFCNQTMPLRSRHCNACGRCTYKWDHHCPFTGNCVGGNNHRYFWTYLLVEAILVLWCLKIMYSTYDGLEYSLRDSYTWPAVMARSLWMMALGFMECVALMLLSFHGYLIVSNRTTREIMMAQRYTHPYPEHLTAHLKSPYMHPFSSGVLRNVWNVITANEHPHHKTCFTAQNASGIPEGHQFTRAGFVSRFPHMRHGRGGHGGHGGHGAQQQAPGQCCQNNGPQHPQHPPHPGHAQYHQQQGGGGPHGHGYAHGGHNGSVPPTGHHAPHMNGMNGHVPYQNHQPHQPYNPQPHMHNGVSPSTTTSDFSTTAQFSSTQFSNSLNPHTLDRGAGTPIVANGQAPYPNPAANMNGSSNGVVQAGTRISVRGKSQVAATADNDDIGCVPVDSGALLSNNGIGERKRHLSSHDE